MKFIVSDRASGSAKSATAVVAERAAELLRNGVKIVDLSEGQAEDIYTPDHIKESAIAAIRGNQTKYTPTAGIPELREAIALRFSRENNISVDASQTIASTGAKQSIFNFIFAVVNPGDEVLVLAPYWVSYIHQVQLAGAIPVIVPTSSDNDYKISSETLQTFVTSRTRALILNNPNNPSGIVYTRDELLDLLHVVLTNDLIVIADEVYDQVVFDGHNHVSFASLNDDALARTVTVNAVSKSYSMTGWRLGFAAGPKLIIDAMERVQSQSTSCPNSIAQWAAVEALTGDQSSVLRLRRELEARCALVQRELHSVPHLKSDNPEGGFFVFPRVEGFKDGAEFAERLLKETGVMTVPGAAFGADNHVRICFAAAPESLDIGISRMKRWLLSEA